MPQKMRRHVTDWEKIFAEDTSDKGLLSKIYQWLLKLSIKVNNLIKKYLCLNCPDGELEAQLVGIW